MGTTWRAIEGNFIFDLELLIQKGVRQSLSLTPFLRFIDLWFGRDVFTHCKDE